MSYNTHSKPYSDYEIDADCVVKLSRACIIYQVGQVDITEILLKVALNTIIPLIPSVVSEICQHFSGGEV
jgi:hypothetical protein